MRVVNSRLYSRLQSSAFKMQASVLLLGVHHVVQDSVCIWEFLSTVIWLWQWPTSDDVQLLFLQELSSVFSLIFELFVWTVYFTPLHTFSVKSIIMTPCTPFPSSTFPNRKLKYLTYLPWLKQNGVLSDVRTSKEKVTVAAALGEKENCQII